MEGWTIKVADGQEIASGDVIAELDEATINATHGGKVRIEGNTVIVSYENKLSETYEIPTNSRIIITDGQKVEAGQQLTEGSLNPHTILKIKGREETERYLLREIQQVYRTQGQNINDKHFEVIIRKMLNKVQITRPGDTDFLPPQDLVDRLEILKLNEELLAKGMKPARYNEVLLGISKASLSTDSFLSAASFQHTIKVLAGAAISSKVDPLYGLKENVIIGKLIPAGTGFRPGRFDIDKQDVEEDADADTHEQLAMFGDNEDIDELFDDVDYDDEDTDEDYDEDLDIDEDEELDVDIDSDEDFDEELTFDEDDETYSEEDDDEN